MATFLEAPSTGGLRVLVQSVESPGKRVGSVIPGLCGTALSVSGACKPKLGRSIEGNKLPSGEEG